MEKLDQSLATLVEKLQGAGFEQAPEVIDGAIRAIYYDGMLQLSFALFFTIILLGLLVLLFIGVFNNDGGVYIGILGSLGCLILIIIWSANNPWLKVFDPQAAFYQQIMKGIL